MAPEPRTMPPSQEQVLAEIAWYRARIRDAARQGRDAARDTRAAYAPSLLRRLQLLRALRTGAAADWRAFRPAGGARVPRDPAAHRDRPVDR